MIRQEAIEREITTLIRGAKYLRTVSEREQGASRLHRLLAERSAAVIAIFDAQCIHGNRRAYGRPELFPDRVATESHMWSIKDRVHAARRGFDTALRQNGRRAA